MNNSLKSKILYLSYACLLLVLAYLIQNLGLLAGDVASLLYDTKLMLMGGTYVHDFFETNPPMIFYLYTPVIILGKLIPVSITSIFRLYVIFLVFVSVTCCVNLLTRIFVSNENKFMFNGFIFILFFILLFLPGCEFGQREHFLMILLLPYLFSAVLADQNKKTPTIFAVFIGLMAGLGMGLKPYFLFPVMLIELYFIISRRSVFAWVRAESIICIIVLVGYLSSVFIFHKNYIDIMLPLISHLYFISIKESWSVIFYRPSVIYCCLVWGCFFLFKKNNQRPLVTILMLALTGMMAAFIVPRSAWYYHVLPALGLACLLAWLYSSHLISVQLKSRVLSKMDVCIFMIAGLLVFMVPLDYFFVNTEKATIEKNGNSFTQLTAYINSLPEPQRLFCFSANTTVDCFPLVDQTHSEFAGRFPFFWWLRGLIQIESDAGKKSLPPMIAHDKKYVMDVVVADLNRYQPTIIIVNRYFENLVLGDNFDYISYFSKNEKFKAAWQHYHYLKTIGVYQLYGRSTTGPV